jgi:hypothetical protein
MTPASKPGGNLFADEEKKKQKYKTSMKNLTLHLLSAILLTNLKPQ